MIPTTSNSNKQQTMKKIFALGWMLVAALALTNCSKEETYAPAVDKDFVVYANLDESRTVAEGYTTSWADGDNLSIFHAVAGEATYVSDGEFTLKNVEAGTFEGTVTGVEEGAAYDWYAYYPYDSHVKSPANTGAGYIEIAKQTQVQEGNSNTTHTSGAPLYGVVKGGSSVAPEFSMKHLSSMVKVNVTNAVDEAISIKSILVETAGTKISGTYYVDITGEEAPEYESSGATYTYTSVNLEVTGEEAIQPEASAAFYLTACPFTAEEGETITVTVTNNGDEVSVREYTIPAGKGFAPGKVTTLNFDFTADSGIEWTTIAEIHAASAEGTYNIKNATVVAVGKYSSLLYDGTGYLYSYQNLGVAVGDIVNITNATTSTYGERQIKSGASVEKIGTTPVEHPTPEVIADATAYNALVSDYTVGQYVTIYASSLSIGSYLNFTVDGGSATGAFVTPSDTAVLVALNGQAAKITGYVCYLYASNYFSVFMTDIEYLTVNPTSLSWNATETTAKTVTVSSNDENWTIDETTVPEWAEVVKTDATTLTITPSANNGEERSATVVLKHATEDISAPITISQGAAGPATSVVYYQKVTSTPSDWSGTYLIVNEDESFVFNGSLTALDASNNYKKVTIADSAIEATEEINGYAFTISAVGDSGTIKSASGYYIGQTTDANGLKSSKATTYSNQLTLNADGSVHIVSGGAYLRFNTTSGQDRFRYYQSSTFANQKAIQLYKLSE